MLRLLLACLIDVPLAFIRVYYQMIGVEVYAVLLVKNVACLAIEISVITTQNSDNMVAQSIENLFDLLPGGDEIRAVSDKELLLSTKGDLEDQKDEIEKLTREKDLLAERVLSKQRQVEKLETISQLVRGVEISHDETLKAFQFFDEDNSGDLSENEVQHMLNMIPMTPEQRAFFNARELFCDMDLDHNGRVSSEEFIHLMRKKCIPEGVDRAAQKAATPKAAKPQ
eukprot:TRINITY_DN80092_c0_g1_i1.p1 TRINITY_DN80092_c0_g1~~TRINITY_DN80092_c0_g1_i1.p1  ORF type:complete len:226 (-),score=46.60 TRINITY_DN80092_c0_g1_i1:49-726(-)